MSANPEDETLFLVDVSGITTHTGDQCGGTIRPPKGDLLAIAPSNMCTTCYDTCEVATVGAGTVECVEGDQAIKHFHFGAASSTAGTGSAWGGVDMRAEVAVLDRSIVIRAEDDYMGQTHYSGSNVDDEAWGCRVLVADWIDNGHDLGSPSPNYAQRRGEVHLDSVEVRNCAQKGTWRAAVKFHGATGAAVPSTIRRSAIHSGQAPGVHFRGSARITFEDNEVVGFVEHGIWVEGSQDLTLTDNWVIYVRPPEYITID